MVVQTISAVAVAVIGGLALGTWRRQLKGQTRFDTAKRLLIASHELAHRFHLARNPFTSSSEFPANYNSIAPNQRTDADEREAWAFIFNARWQPVREAYANIEGLLPEARAMLSEEAADAGDQMLGCARQLHFWMTEFVRLFTTAPADPTQATKLQKEARDAVFAAIPQPGVEVDNRLTLELMERQSALVAALKPYIDMA